MLHTFDSMRFAADFARWAVGQGSSASTEASRRGIDPATISRMRAGKLCLPQATALLRMAKAMDVNPCEYLCLKTTTLQPSPPAS